MQAITFENWSRRELAGYNGNAFRFGLLCAQAQSPGNSRLKALLLLYALSADRVGKLFEFLWNEEIRTEYRSVSATLSSRSIEKLALRGTPMRSIPDCYTQVMSEFAEAYRAPEAKAATKHGLWEATRAAQLRAGVTNAEIYQALDLNPGNANAYLKHGDVSKVSLANARRINDFVQAQRIPKHIRIE